MAGGGAAVSALDFFQLTWPQPGDLPQQSDLPQPVAGLVVTGGTG